jgi:hypothetical protein
MDEIEAKELRWFELSSKLEGWGLSVVSYRLWVVSCELWVVSCELWVVRRGMCGVSCELWVVSCELWVEFKKFWDN